MPVPTVETVVTVPVTARAEGLVRISVEAASFPLPVPPGQNQADDSAPTGVTLVSDTSDPADPTPPTVDPVPLPPRVAPSATPIPIKRTTTPTMSTARRRVSVIASPPR